MAATTAFLSGLRVLDLSIWRPGPYATSLLVPLGADVLKVEPPGGDPMRHYPGLFAAVNEGKRSVELDLKDTDERARALELAAQADVLVEGFRPGVLARLGLDEAAVRARNPGIVYCSISGYGQHDPRATLPGHDVNYQAWSGALTPEGGMATTIPPLPTADLAAGLTAAFGICAAVLGADHQRRGHLPRRLHDRRAGHLDRSRRCRGGGRVGGGIPVRTHARLRPLRDGRRRAGGARRASTSSTSGRACARSSASRELADLGFDERCRRGAELQRAVAEAIATQTPGRAGGPPRRRRRARRSRARPRGDAGRSPFPRFPIRLPLPEAARPVPTLDQHRGEGFSEPG